MALSLEPLKLPPWDPARADEWNAAYEKVDNYLRACRVSSRLHRARLTSQILCRVYARSERGELKPGVSFSEAAINEVRSDILAWLEPHLRQNDGKTPVSFGEAMLALYLGDGPTLYPYSFLDATSMPPALVKRMDDRVVQAGPGLSISSMVPRDPDLGVPSLVGNAVEKIESSPVIQAIVVWIIFIIVAGVSLFWYTR